MTLGDIKLQSLKLMFAGNGKDIAAEDLDGLRDTEEYRDYLTGITGAVNRCFADLERKRVLPIRRFALRADVGDSMDAFTAFDLVSLIGDFFDIERITYMRGNAYDGNVAYFREGNVIVIHDFDENAAYSVLYRPTIPRVMEWTSHDAEIGVPEGIAVCIPYFVKGELFRVDEPDEAAEARNWYEAAMVELAAGERTGGSETGVRSVFDFSEV